MVKYLRNLPLLGCLLLLGFFLAGCSGNPIGTTPNKPEPVFQATDSTFEVMTWNVQDFPRQGVTTIGLLVKIIRTLNVDVVALQEITDSLAFRQLLDSLPGWQGWVASSSAYDINLAFIFKSDTRQSGTVTEILNTSANHRPLPRYPLWLHLIWNGQTIEIINNHYKASGDGILDSDPYDEERRRYDASILLDNYVRTYLPDANVIILGDLNDELTDPEPNNVFQPFLSRPAEYLFCDMSIALGNQTDWSYPTYPSHIDHILISNELFDEFRKAGSLVKTIKAEEFLPEGWNEYAVSITDHRPVALKLVF